jgi:ABC-type transport system involved in multi-copper enzyme maturation permease subunit
MLKLLKNFGLPLLAKELIEQSARRRTYIVRVVYASLLFFTAFLIFYQKLRIGTTSPIAVLGKGKDLFMGLVALQFAGIYFFMPAMTCGVVTQEKERASLQLLFLTRLGPWTILFEKLSGRVIPMLFFLLLSLPLLAFAYTLGGLTLPTLLTGVYLLSLAVVQMGTLALCCSAFFRTTVGAFIWSFLLAIGMFFGPALGWVIVKSITGFDILQHAPTVGAAGAGGPIWEVLVEMPLFGLAHFIVETQFRSASYWPIGIHTLFVAAQSGLCLVMARVFLVRRAFLAPRNVVLNVFKILDRIFLRLNNNPLTKGIVFGGKATSLPDGDPVAWRETTKRSLGKGQYLARVFIAIEIPVAILCLIVIFDALNAEPLELLLLVLWVVAVLMVSVQGASLIAGERSHQTLDVLASTPLRARDIIRQKFRSVRRLILVLCIPFVTIFAFTAGMRWKMPDLRFWNFPGYQPPEFRLGVYLTCSLLSILIYLPLVAWMSFYIGLVVKTQARAIVGALGAVLAWCIGPLIFILLPLEIIFHPTGYNTSLYFWNLTSPAAIVAINEECDWRIYSDRPWLAMALNFAWYGGCLALFRWLCFAQTDRMLGRVEVKEIDEQVWDRAAAARATEPELTQV